VTRAPTPNDFAVLGLKPGAGDDEIRDAYRRLAKIHHPDRNPGDPQALATFRRLSESYAALRSRVRARTAPPRTPLSAAVRQRTSSRRVPTAAGTTVADLPLGGSTWVAADAVLVAPGRTAALRPDAPGSAFPSAQHVIRVERRGDGHHVFMPPQPSARWPLSEAAETDGLAVAALWVGDRQMTGTVGEMGVDERGWVARDALAVDTEGSWSLDVSEPLGRVPHRSTPVRVLRDADGFRAHCDLPSADWAPSDGGHARRRVPVLEATLDGVAHLTPRKSS
jgi:hypothetical protein